MLNRAVIQPDPTIFIGAAADIMETASTAGSPDELFLGLEERGVVLRIDRTLTPTMAKTPTLAQWELDLLRTIGNVVRHGHLRAVEPGRLVFVPESVQIAGDALVVHCAASGLQYPPLVPIWEPGTITLQPIRAGFPCFGAALAGFVEATISTDEEKNRLCPPTPLSNTPADWLVMQVLGSRASASFTSNPDIKAWADTVALNPVRAPDGGTDPAAYGQARERLSASIGPGLKRMAELAGMA